MTVEYDCEGCGAHVFGSGRDTVPKSHMCTVCEWLCEHVPDPEAMMDLRQRQGLLDGSPLPPAPR